jgi:uncharacterized RDD family membrane protein YckC
VKDTNRFPWERSDDTVVFETPEQTQIELRLAPFGTRIVAALIDRLLMTLVSVLVVLVMSFIAVVGGLPGGEDGFLTVFAVCMVFQFLFSLFYFVWGEVRWEGQTLGKRWMKIRTMMVTGQGVTLGAAIIRNLARLVDEIPLLWVVPALVRGKRRAGDLLAGTIVVLVTERTESDALTRWRLAASYEELTDRRFYFSAEVARSLYPDDLNLLEHLAEEVRDAPFRTQQRVLRSVAQRYVDRLALQNQAEEALDHPSRFLRELTLFLEDHLEGQAY